MDPDRQEDERGEGSLDVPLEPVGGGRSGRRRAGLVLSGSIALVAVAIALAAWPTKPERSSDPNLGRDVALATGSAVPTVALSAPSPTTSQPKPSRREVLPTLANDVLPGAPNPVLVERHDNDARLFAWNPGGSFRRIRTFSGAFTAESQFAFVSPDAESIVVASFGSGGEEGADNARLLTGDGRVAWESDEVTTSRGVVWSSDSRKLVVGGASGAWIVVTIDSGGTATEQRIVVTDAPLAQTPGSSAPGPSPLDPAYSLVPVAFSANDRWIYGAPVSGTSGSLRPTVRVSIPRGTIEAISHAPTSGPDRIGPGDGRGGLDPVTGRAIRWGANASIPGGPPTVEVTEADGSLAYRVDVGVVLGANWDADGDLLLLAADGYPFPIQVSLLEVAPDGAVGPAVLSTGSVAWGELIGVRDGFAILALATRQPDEMTQLVVVNLVDAKATGVTLPADHGAILGAGLLP